MDGTAARRPPQHDPLDEGQRIEWSTAILVFLQIAVAVPLTLLLFTSSGQIPPFILPIVIFLLLRIPADTTRAFFGPRPATLALEGTLKALSWGFLPFGLKMAFAAGGSWFGPPWLTGTALALLALSLWGHHARAETHAPRVAKVEGITGAVVAPFALALASTVLTTTPPWTIVVPALVLIVTGTLAVRGIVRLAGRSERHAPASGWTGWYQAHFFRLTILIAAVVVYLFIRDMLAGWIPFLFVFEYSFAVFVAAGFLWSLRAYARKQVTDQIPIGPHRRHKQAIERQGEQRFDLLESAFGRFLETGESDDLAAATRELESEGIPAGAALHPVLGHRSPSGVLLVHPGWLYAARLVAVALLAGGFVAALPAMLQGRLGLLAFGVGIYTAQWNRYGGHWAAKSGLGLAGLFLLMVWLVRSGFVVGPVLIGLTVAFGLVFVHPLRARKGRPIPRFLYQGTDPRDAILPLIERYDRSVRIRALWLTGIGVLVFIFVSELSRLLPEAEIIFFLYVIMAFASVVHPLLTTIGLRVGRLEAERRHERSRKRREMALQGALTRLEEAMRTGPVRIGASARRRDR